MPGTVRHRLPEVTGLSIPLPTAPTPLPHGGLRALLRRLGSPDQFGNPAPAITGRIVLTDEPRQREGSVWLRSGRVYAISFTGFVPPIATRLMSGGMLTHEQYQYLLTLPAEQCGPECVRLGYAAPDVVEDVNRQMMLSSLTHLYGWSDSLWTWRDGEETPDFVVPGLETNLVVAAADERIGQWDTLARNFPQIVKSHAVPLPGPDWGDKTGERTTPEMAAILRMVDGTTSVSRIANACGFTRFEIAARLAKAIADGVLVIPDPDTGQVTETDFEPDPLTVEYEEAMREVETAQQALAEAQARLEAAREALGR